ncbi:HipA domain-containing protein [Dyadobacter fanqingshengii]|uniref:HipA domain-containing protein n=1 Tax=Dyadobacter fanqingshengii TaxID=2906443 RepID=A0A9X1PAY4_9BACT|nr:HipA domain-containing protein [Dyadobacter fanqingshengii]MCF0041911.1 HipA domain-containing protein [Dyadobacter fanqingshengii]USJ36383.1 HipA domain-containing protein [Dyadobacter fanqingshengii]
MENRKCLYCYKPLESSATGDFHNSCNLEFFESRQTPVFEYSLNQMSELAKSVVERSVAVPGVQPKLSLSLVDDAIGNGGRGRLTIVGALGGNYIFKPPMEKYPDMPQNEHVTMRIAEAFGLKTVKSSLIRLQSGELAYITKRIDRTKDNEKIHMLDMFQILEAFDKYKGSMERVGKALKAYSANTLLDQLYFFELSIFSFLTGNNDMHLKNFSMINVGNDWLLAPAYDLLNVTIVNPEDTEELALTLEGKKNKLKREHFETLGKGLELNDKQISGVFRRFEKNRPTAIEWIDKSFLSDHLKLEYKSILEARYTRLAK